VTIYKVIDNGQEVLVTCNELKALRLLRAIMEKHDVTWGWIDDVKLES
jgi:hypothetical protein